MVAVVVVVLLHPGQTEHLLLAATGVMELHHQFLALLFLMLVAGVVAVSVLLVLAAQEAAVLEQPLEQQHLEQLTQVVAVVDLSITERRGQAAQASYL
jgi:hypothetical protein